MSASFGTPTFSKLSGVRVYKDGTFDFDVTTGDDRLPVVTELTVGENGRADFKDFQPFTKMTDLIIRMDPKGFLTATTRTASGPPRRA